jgi:hypothetical protein
VPVPAAPVPVQPNPSPVAVAHEGALLGTRKEGGGKRKQGLSAE